YRRLLGVHPGCPECVSRRQPLDLQKVQITGLPPVEPLVVGMHVGPVDRIRHPALTPGVADPGCSKSGGNSTMVLTTWVVRDLDESEVQAGLFENWVWS
ncbi:MAG: hypothetical protein VX249_10070, partial [Pseudomonadota bacterium]|nr:hypothetical protein [Pseudomonadota bacterium]